MRIDPIRRGEAPGAPGPIPAVRASRRRTARDGDDPREQHHPREQPDPGRDDDPRDDGLPHIDLRA